MLNHSRYLGSQNIVETTAAACCVLLFVALVFCLRVHIIVGNASSPLFSLPFVDDRTSSVLFRYRMLHTFMPPYTLMRHA
mmetsp:Transcript_7284/g.10587  ORF Transcript_7284/g.10587 Transcript_7284/m.10587 type:complete len:80 (-) Transcript_7284:221-460(-)